MADVATLPGLGMSTFPLFVPTSTGTHGVTWDGTGKVSFNVPWTLHTPSSASVQATSGQLVTMSVLQSLTETVRNVRVSFESVLPSNMDQIGPKALLDGKEDFAEALRETGFRPEWPANVRFSRQKAFACCGMHACTCRLSAAQAPRARLCTCGRTFSAPALRCDDCARFQEALKNF